MDVTMANGKEMRLQLEHVSRYEIQKMVDTWKYSNDFLYNEELHALQPPPGEDTESKEK
jgi:hypothetical protein